jgi:hypothetical protein
MPHAEERIEMRVSKHGPPFETPAYSGLRRVRPQMRML